MATGIRGRFIASDVALSREVGVNRIRSKKLQTEKCSFPNGAKEQWLRAENARLRELGPRGRRLDLHPTVA